MAEFETELSHLVNLCKDGKHWYKFAWAKAKQYERESAVYAGLPKALEAAMKPVDAHKDAGIK